MAFRSIRFTNDAILEAASNNAPALCQGATGPAVSAIQQALVDLGYPMPISMANGDSTPDGIFGDETAATVKTFQKELQLTADGIVGRNTMRALDEQSAFEDLRPVRDTVDQIGVAVDLLARSPDASQLLRPTNVDALWSRTATIKATLMAYEPGASLPTSRIPRLWMARIPTSQEQGLSGAAVGANPLSGAIAVLLLAIFSVMRPTQKKWPSHRHSKSSKATHPGPGLNPAVLIPVVKAWEFLIFAEVVTKATADAIWRKIKYEDDYERLRRCKDRNPRVSPECAEAWKQFDEIRTKLLQRLYSLSRGGQVAYPSLVDAINTLLNGGTIAGVEGIGYIKALLAVQKCFNCTLP